MTLDDIADKTAVIDSLKAELGLAERSQSWAAKKLDITRAYMSLVLTKKQEPSTDLVIEMKKLADKLKSSRVKEAV